ncbi:MAG: sugar ABC transporter permease [Clostridium sp.]|jgi:ABC-type sugar transport system permease subunit|nr:sugar ABC transporter permease [Clostridium sp.]
MKKKKKKSRATLLQKRNRTGYLFILPWLIGFLLFYVRSIFMTGQFSFSELTVDTVNGGYELRRVGWENFLYAFRAHGTFKQVLTSSVLNMLIDVPLIIFFSLFMAMLLNGKFRGRMVVRAIFFLPVIMGSGAILDALTLSASMMSGGLSTEASEVASAAAGASVSLDYYMDLFQTLAIPERILEYIVTAVNRINDIISASGVQIIIFIAALQAIPGSMYEVAKMEGATGYETFWKVTFPMVMPHIITNVVYTIVDSFTVSEVVDLAYDTAFVDFNYGLSSVFSVVSTLATCLILVAVCGFLQRRTFYYH